MAPEVLQLHRYDAKADLWSVGTILFELLTGKPPFNGVNHLQLIQNIERGDAVLPEHVARSLSPGCRQLIHQLLRRNPVERISFNELFVHPFVVGEAASAAAGSALPAADPLGLKGPAGAPHPQQQPTGPHYQRRHAPTSHGAVRILQPTRAANPIHPALAVPSPTGSQQVQIQQHQQGGISAKGAVGAATVAGAVAATVHSSLAAQTSPVLPPAPGPESGAAATPGPSVGGGGGRQPGIAAINVRELTRSPSPRIMAAAAAVESAFQGDTAVGPAASATGANLSVAVAEAVPGSSGSCARPLRGPAAPLLLDRIPSGLVATPSASSNSLGDSLDSDYVVVASPSTASRPAPMSMSPRTPHPAMACVSGRSSAQSSRNGSGGGVGPQPTSLTGPAQVSPAPAPMEPDAAITIPPGPCSRGQAGLNTAPTAAATTPTAPGPALVAAAAAAAAAPPVAWQQLLSPIAAATLPPSHHSNPHNPTPLAAAVATAGAPSLSPAIPRIPTYPAANAAAAATTTVTIRVPPPGCFDGSAGDPQLLPRLVGLLLDDAGRRCSALLDQEAEARQLGAAQSAAMAAAGDIGSFVAGGGLGPGGGEVGDGETQLAEEAASAVGTYLVACRLLLAALNSNTPAGQPPLGASQEGGRAEKHATGSGAPRRSPSGKGLRAEAEAEADSPAAAAAALAALVPTGANAVMPSSVPVVVDMTDGSGDGKVEAQELTTDVVTSAVTSPSSSSGPSLAVLSALAVHARSLLAALDEHLHGTVARLLLSGSEGSELPPSSRPPLQTPEACGTFPDTATIPASPGPVVPCGMDTLLATAVHHSRAAAGEELLGNAAGAADQYGRAADVLLFLLSAPQHPSHPSKVPGGGQEALVEAVRPPLPPHERQRITKYYAAVRLRQSAVLAALGPTAASLQLHPSLQLPAGPQSLPRPELPAPYAPGRPPLSHPVLHQALHPGPNLHVRHPSAGGTHGSAVEGVTAAAAPVAMQAESRPYGYAPQPRVYGAVVF
ncbi:hypothetical protein VaNZ11_004907 [Volvox africanus]|uniref:Protein kinase domain-containing protein n=1 Tax=Volvox africanus TaxID=51714 RepID=A0ABQ5RXP5_9CHLO|nr:hypothetical protein VaNZ11_004907 [Volvox africanus]